MIRNDRQLKSTQDKIERLIATQESFESEIDRLSYRQLIERLDHEMREYRSIRDGNIRSFDVTSVDDLGSTISKVRISKGLTQKQLGEELGVAEQQVQRDESRDYEHASLTKLAEIFDILGYELVGTLRPKQARFVTDPMTVASSSTRAPIRATATPGKLLRIFLSTESGIIFGAIEEPSTQDVNASNSFSTRD